MVDYISYKNIILNSIDVDMYHLVERREIDKYMNYDKYMIEFDYLLHQPKKYIVGYFVSTIEGNTWMPVFNYKKEMLRNKMHLEFADVIVERKKNQIIQCLCELGIPDTALRIIRVYLSIQSQS